MHLNWLSFLRCPECLCPLRLLRPDVSNNLVRCGRLVCEQEGHNFEIKDGMAIFGVRAVSSDITLREIKAEQTWQLETIPLQKHLEFARQAAIEGLIAIKTLLKYLPIPKNLKVLDAGAGPGMQSWQLAQFGFNVMALELSPLLMKSVPLDIQNCLQINRAASDITLMPFADNTFDIIFAKQILHHIEDLELAIREFQRVVKRDGFLVLIEPCWPQVHSNEGKEKLKNNDVASQVGIAHAFHCYSNYLNLLNKYSNPLYVEAIPRRGVIGGYIYWFASESKKLPQIFKKLFNFILWIYDLISQRFVTSYMNRYGGRFQMIRRFKNKSTDKSQSRKIVDFTSLLQDLQEVRIENLKDQNEQVFQIFKNSMKL